jgi:hypothetical protein
MQIIDTAAKGLCFWRVVIREPQGAWGRFELGTIDGYHTAIVAYDGPTIYYTRLGKDIVDGVTDAPPDGYIVSSLVGDVEKLRRRARELFAQCSFMELMAKGKR